MKLEGLISLITSRKQRINRLIARVDKDYQQEKGKSCSLFVSPQNCLPTATSRVASSDVERKQVIKKQMKECVYIHARYLAI